MIIGQALAADHAAYPPLVHPVGDLAQGFGGGPQVVLMFSMSEGAPEREPDGRPREMR